MYYLTYYSKPRGTVGMSEAELQKEKEYNKDKRVTKIITDATKQLPSYAKTLQPIVVNTTTVAIGYMSFQIPKASGGYRTIEAPNEQLKEIQQQLLKWFNKEAKYLPHNAVHGFTVNRNCKTALEVHKKNKSRWFLKLDIKNFFPSITSDHVRYALQHTYPIGCYMLTDVTWNRLVNLCTYEGRLPQGAPTSPIITNMVMCPFDIQIAAYCKEEDLIYTRYADDILISSKTSFNWVNVQTAVQEILEPMFRLNTEKRRYGSFNGRNWNLGLMYNNKYEVTVGHKKKQLVKNMIHNYNTKPECHTAEFYVKLNGILGYCKFIEPEYFTPLMNSIEFPV